MKRLFIIISVISLVAASGIILTACGSNDQSSGESVAEQTTAAAKETTAPAEKATAQQTTEAPKSDDDKKSSETESKASESKSEDSGENADSGEFAGIAEEDAKAMALLDLVTEDASVESCKQGKNKDGAEAWVIILKDADNDRYISYVNSKGSSTLPYSE